MNPSKCEVVVFAKGCRASAVGHGLGLVLGDGTVPNADTMAAAAHAELLEQADC